MFQNLVDDASWASGQKISIDIDISQSEIWVVLPKDIKSKSRTEVNLYRQRRVNDLDNNVLLLQLKY